MFLTFFKSELAFWSKSLMLWIFLVVSTILVVTILTAQDPILDDVLFGNSFRNSPFVIQRLYGMMAVFGCLMVTAFVNSAATRDFTCKTAPLIFTKPIGKYSYLMGRFWAAMFISLIPMLGVSLAVFFFSSHHAWTTVGTDLAKCTLYVCFDFCPTQHIPFGINRILNCRLD